jgi:hypothetical protein
MDARHLLVAVGLLTPAQAAAHQFAWYDGLRDGLGRSCCDNRDCKPVEMCSADGIGEGILINGACTQVPYDKVLPLAAPDGNAHACWYMSGGKPYFRCVILPGLT